MIDAKMRGLLSGLGGAFCLLCTVSKDSACGRSENNLPVDCENFFTINRSEEITTNDYRRLSDDHGAVKRKKGDYDDRKGLTQRPTVSIDLNMVSPLHSLMRSFDFLLTLLYHLRSETFKWTDSAKQLGDSYQRFVNAKEEVKSIVKEKTHIVMDAADPTGKGGNTNKGDVCERLLTTHRSVLVSTVPQRFQADFALLLARLWICVKVYTSKDKIHVVRFKEFCMDTYKLLLSKFANETKWISISPTLHALLAHGWELISVNDGIGLGEYSEGGLEHSNKFLRFYRSHLSRKISQETNLSDCLTRLWLRSDPVIQNEAFKPLCSKCKLFRHFSVSCPAKNLVVDSVLSLDEFYLSVLVES